jgi:hypothetical protein
MINVTHQQKAANSGYVTIGRLTIHPLTAVDGEPLVRLTIDGRSSTYTLDRLELELAAAQRQEDEEILMVPVDRLPYDRQWSYLEDCGVLAVASSLDEAGRQRARAEALSGR